VYFNVGHSFWGDTNSVWTIDYTGFDAKRKNGSETKPGGMRPKFNEASITGGKV